MRCVLLNVAHKSRCPRRSEGAAVRLLGIFSSVDNLKKHVANHYTSDIDLISIPLRKWAAILATTSGANEMQHLENLASAYHAQLKTHEAEFRSNVIQQRTGDVTTNESSHPTRLGAHDLQEAPHINREAEIRMQRFAIISILPDVEQNDPSLQQPAILVWDAFDGEEDARKAIKEDLSHIARDVHLDIVLMYEWLPLTNLDLSQVQEEFRDESLTDIMQTRKNESKQVARYRNVCQEKGQEANMLDLTGPPVEDSQVPLPLELQDTLPNLADPSMTEEINGMD